MADAPGKMKYAVVEMDTVDYADQATTALLTPDSNPEVLRTLVPDGAIVDEDSPTWTFQLAGPQGTAFYAALYAAMGTVVDFVFQAEFGTGKTVQTFSALVPSTLPLGGEQGAWRLFDITCQVQGQPVKSTSA
jgi:hypothetical protein